jgi:hypothetical protein
MAAFLWLRATRYLVHRKSGVTSFLPAAVVIGLGLGLNGPVAAQVPVGSGDSVRIRLMPMQHSAWPSSWIVGTVIAARSDSLWLRVHQRSALADFAAADIARLEAYGGVTPFGRRRGLLIGVGIGAGIGAIVQAIHLTGPVLSSEDEAFASVSIALAGVLGAVVGGAAGWAIGGSSVAVWQPAPLPAAPTP